MNKNYKKAQKPVSRTNSKSAKAYTIPKKHILIILGDKLLKLYQGQEKLFQAEIVIGGGPLTPTGTFRAGSWVKDKIYPLWALVSADFRKKWGFYKTWAKYGNSWNKRTWMVLGS